MWRALPRANGRLAPTLAAFLLLTSGCREPEVVGRRGVTQELFVREFERTSSHALWDESWQTEVPTSFASKINRQIFEAEPHDVQRVLVRLPLDRGFDALGAVRHNGSTRSWVGKESRNGHSVIIHDTGDSLVGGITGPNFSYVLREDFFTNVTVLDRLSQRAELSGNDATCVRCNGSMISGGGQPCNNPTGPRNATLLLIYDKSMFANNVANRRGALVKAAQDAIIAFTDTSVSVSLTVLEAEVEYTDAQSAGSDFIIQHMLGDTRFTPSLRCLRYCWNVDVVAYVTERKLGRACLATTKHAFAVAFLAASASNWLLAHELGHAFGADHEQDAGRCGAYACAGASAGTIMSQQRTNFAFGAGNSSAVWTHAAIVDAISGNNIKVGCVCPPPSPLN